MRKIMFFILLSASTTQEYIASQPTLQQNILAEPKPRLQRGTTAFLGCTKNCAIAGSTMKGFEDAEACVDTLYASGRNTPEEQKEIAHNPKFIGALHTWIIPIVNNYEQMSRDDQKRCRTFIDNASSLQRSIKIMFMRGGNKTGDQWTSVENIFNYVSEQLSNVFVKNSKTLADLQTYINKNDVKAVLSTPLL